MTDAAATPPFWCARLDAAQAAEAWPAARKHIVAALERGDGLYTESDVLCLVTDPGSGWHLWILGEWPAGEKPRLLAAWCSHPITFPRGTVLYVPHAGGEEMARWYGTALAATERYARESGCARLWCAGREGWGRRGYRRIGSIFERRL